MAKDKDLTLEERYADDILTDNTQFDNYKQCKNCAFRDKTAVRGVECGWKKGVCEIYQYPGWKPHEIMRNREVCEFHIKDKG